MSAPLTLRRSVQKSGDDELRGPWSVFRDTIWPDLRRDTLALADLLDEFNPRFEVLCELLNWARENRPRLPGHRPDPDPLRGERLLAELSETRPDLDKEFGDGNPATARIAVVPYSLRLPWAAIRSVQLHPEVPAPWLRSALVSGEPNEHIVARGRR